MCFLVHAWIVWLSLPNTPPPSPAILRPCALRPCGIWRVCFAGGQTGPQWLWAGTSRCCRLLLCMLCCKSIRHRIDGNATHPCALLPCSSHQINLPSGDFYRLQKHAADADFLTQLLCITADHNPSLGASYPGEQLNQSVNALPTRQQWHQATYAGTSALFSPRHLPTILSISVCIAQ